MRAAMVGGAGYAAGKRRQRGNTREAEQEQRLETLEGQQAAPPAAAPAPAASGGDDLVAKLKELKGLADDGTLTPDEFEAAKQKLIAGGP